MDSLKSQELLLTFAFSVSYNLGKHTFESYTFCRHTQRVHRNYSIHWYRHQS